MSSFIFFSTVDNKQFQLFSPSHTIFLIITSVIIFLLATSRQLLQQNGKFKLYIRYIFASILFFSESMEQIIRIVNGTWSVRVALPLHLCGISSIICIIMLVTESYRLFEIMYFWCLIGSPMALILPDLKVSYTDINFWLFMISHSMNIISAAFMMTAYRYRPIMSSIKVTFLYTNVYMIFIACFNYIFGSNYYYFYLCKDPSPSFVNPIKFINSWPLIVFLIEVFTLLAICLYYLPYYIKDHIKKSNKITIQL